MQELKEHLTVTLEALENVHLDERSRYRLQERGTHVVDRIVNREQYLEIIVEALINDVEHALDLLEESNEK